MSKVIMSYLILASIGVAIPITTLIPGYDGINTRFNREKILLNTSSFMPGDQAKRLNKSPREYKN